MKERIDRYKKHFPWMTLLLLTLAIGAADSDFLNPESLIRTASDVSTLFIMALGMTFVIYAGGIDLSSQSIANMITVISALYIATWGIGTVFICALIGAVLGMISGGVISRLKIPSFISTLATGGIAYSMAQYFSGERALLMDAEIRNQTFGFILDSTRGIPHELIIALFLLALALFTERRTKIGRFLKAIGTSEPAAIASGVPVKKYKVLAFAISGGFAAIAGFIFSINLAGGSPTIAEGFLLPSIVAVLVGGTPLTGGVGGVLNTFIGALIVAVIRTGMVYLEVPATGQQMFFGIVLILAIALTIDRSKIKIVK